MSLDLLRDIKFVLVIGAGLLLVCATETLERDNGESMESFLTYFHAFGVMRISRAPISSVTLVMRLHHSDDCADAAYDFSTQSAKRGGQLELIQLLSPSIARSMMRPPMKALLQ